VTTGDTDARPLRLAGASDLESAVERHDRLLVELYTEGCPACASMEPVLGTVARASDATVALLNPRDDPELVERYEVASVPTLLLFEDGALTDRLAAGFQGVEAVLEFVGREA
jgi:thioredoxin-like negative regulator of GroEL